MISKACDLLIRDADMGKWAQKKAPRSRIHGTERPSGASVMPCRSATMRERRAYLFIISHFLAFDNLFEQPHCKTKPPNKGTDGHDNHPPVRLRQRLAMFNHDLCDFNRRPQSLSSNTIVVKAWCNRLAIISTNPSSWCMKSVLPEYEDPA